MSRTIDADLAIKGVDERLLYRAKDVERLINSIPTADVIPRTKEAAIDFLHEIGWMQEHDKELTSGSEPVRHGHWIVGMDFSDGTEAFICSLCGHAEKWNEPYCNCGAKMDEEGEPKEENKCGDCTKFEECKEYTTEEETFPEVVGGCKAFEKGERK